MTVCFLAARSLVLGLLVSLSSWLVPGRAAQAGGKAIEGVVNVNTAPAATLGMLPGIGPAKVQSILAYRQRRPFRTVDELVRIKGISSKMVKRLRPHLAASGPSTARLLTARETKAAAAVAAAPSAAPASLAVTPSAVPAPVAVAAPAVATPDASLARKPRVSPAVAPPLKGRPANRGTARPPRGDGAAGWNSSARGSLCLPPP